MKEAYLVKCVAVLALYEEALIELEKLAEQETVTDKELKATTARVKRLHTLADKLSK